MVLENVILVVTIHLRISIVGDSSVCRHDRHGLRNCLSKSNVPMPYGCLFCLQLRMKYQIQQEASRRVHTKRVSPGLSHVRSHKRVSRTRHRGTGSERNFTHVFDERAQLSRSLCGIFVCKPLRNHTGKHAFVSCMRSCTPSAHFIHNIIILIILTKLCTNLLNHRRCGAVFIRSSLFLYVPCASS